MQLKFIVTKADGSVAIVGSGRLEDLQRQFGPEFSVDDLRQLVIAKSIAPDSTYEEMPEGWEPPTDRLFRDAWRSSPSAESAPHGEEPKIHVDMPHARQILRDKMRRRRMSAWGELDAEYMKADEAGDTAKKQEVAGRKQALRDITKDPAIDAAKTPDELKAAWPKALKWTNTS